MQLNLSPSTPLITAADTPSTASTAHAGSLNTPVEDVATSVDAPLAPASSADAHVEAFAASANFSVETPPPVATAIDQPMFGEMFHSEYEEQTQLR